MYLTIQVDGVCLLDALFVTWGRQKRRKLLIFGTSESDLESDRKQHKRMTTNCHDYDERSVFDTVLEVEEEEDVVELGHC